MVCAVLITACHTGVVCSPQGVVLVVESLHDDLPARTNVLKLFALVRQLLPDVLSLENVLKE